MERQYGIAVRNKFEMFLDDDTDPLEILRVQEEEKKKKDESKGKDAKSVKDSKSAKNKKNKATLNTTQEQSIKPTESRDAKKDDKIPRNKSRQNEDRPNRPPRDNCDRDLPPRRQDSRGERPSSGFGAPTTSPTSNEFADRGEGRGRGGRGRGGFRGGRGRGGFDRFGKRDFDRHSGSDKTGIKPTDKREGGGAHNWGTVKDDIEEQMNTTNASEENPDWAAPTEDAENQPPVETTEDGEVVAEEEDAEPKEMTLDEWKAIQAKEKKIEFNIRRPGEGCDDSQWKKTYMLKKKVEEEESEEEEEEEYEEHRSKKAFVPIPIRFADAPRRGGGRARGGRGREGGEFRGGEFRGGEFRGGEFRGEAGEFRGRGGEGGEFRGRGRGGEGGEFRGRGRGGEGGEFRGRGRGFGGSRGGGEFRGRGGNRGRGGAGSVKREQAPNVEDELDFPSLGKPGA